MFYPLWMRGYCCVLAFLSCPAAIWVKSSASVVVWCVDKSLAGVRGGKAELTPLCLLNSNSFVGKNNGTDAVSIYLG